MGSEEQERIAWRRFLHLARERNEGSKEETALALIERYLIPYALSHVGFVSADEGKEDGG